MGCLFATAARAQPAVPLSGFTPLVAATTSDERKNGEFEWEHTLRESFSGNPLSSDPATDYAVAVVDTGASVNLFGAGDVVRSGVTGDFMTDNFLTITGTSGEVSAPISQPIGIFAQGFGAIDNAGRLDISTVKGQTNVSAVAIPIDSDPDTASIPTVVGVPLLAFYTTVIRNDNVKTINVRGQEFSSPDVQILNQFDPNIPVLKHSIPIEFGGPLPATTASYSALDLLDPFNADFTTPLQPTLLSPGAGSFIGGGNFFSKMRIGQGELSPTNPVEEIRVLVDTGAQASILSRAVAADLNIDLNSPDFTLDVLGIGGLNKDVPGFYIDFVRLNASGGALEFSKVPFLVLDVQSPEGGLLDGVMGTNFFWNRNVVFEPSLTDSAFLHISEPLFGPEVMPGDINFDLQLDASDISELFSRREGDLETSDPAKYDLTDDFLVNDKDVTFLIENIFETRFGDANLDGSVDLVDFDIMKTRFGQDGDWNGGDFDGDGQVSLADFGLLKENFGFSRPAAVPEPASILLLSLGLTLLAARLPRRSFTKNKSL